MFKEMRRKKQQLSRDVCDEVLHRGTSGVLALQGEDGFPYAVPLSYVYDDNKLYIHCATSGHKLDAIAHNNKVSFCVIDQDQIVPEKFTTYFRSVIVYGTIKQLEEEHEKRAALKLFANRYSPTYEATFQKEVDNQLPRTCILVIDILHLTGKEALELVKAKEQV